MQSANILLQPGVMPRLLQGLWVTIWLAAVSVALSVPVGLVTGWLMTLRNPVIRVIMRIYLDFIRIMQIVCETNSMTKQTVTIS